MLKNKEKFEVGAKIYWYDFDKFNPLIKETKEFKKITSPFILADDIEKLKIIEKFTFQTLKEFMICGDIYKKTFICQLNNKQLFIDYMADNFICSFFVKDFYTNSFEKIVIRWVEEKDFKWDDEKINLYRKIFKKSYKKIQKKDKNHDDYLWELKNNLTKLNKDYKGNPQIDFIFNLSNNNIYDELWYNQVSDLIYFVKINMDIIIENSNKKRDNNLINLTYNK